MEVDDEYWLAWQQAIGAREGLLVRAAKSLWRIGSALGKFEERIAAALLALMAAIAKRVVLAGVVMMIWLAVAIVLIVLWYDSQVRER